MTSSQVPCSKGIECPFGSSLDALLSGSSPFGDRFVPKIQPGWGDLVRVVDSSLLRKSS